MAAARNDKKKTQTDPLKNPSPPTPKISTLATPSLTRQRFSRALTRGEGLTDRKTVLCVGEAEEKNAAFGGRGFGRSVFCLLCVRGALQLLLRTSKNLS